MNPLSKAEKLKIAPNICKKRPPIGYFYIIWEKFITL